MSKMKNMPRLYTVIMPLIILYAFMYNPSRIKSSSRNTYQFLTFDSCTTTKATELARDNCAYIDKLKNLASSIEETKARLTISEYLKNDGKYCSNGDGLCVVQFFFDSLNVCDGEIVAIEFGNLEEF